MKCLCLCQLFLQSPALFLDLLILKKFDLEFLDLIFLAIQHFLQRLDALLLFCYYVKEGFFLLIVVLPLLIFSAFDLSFLQRCASPFQFLLFSNSLWNYIALHLILPKYFILLPDTLQINGTLNTHQPLILFHRQLTRQFGLIGSPPEPLILNLIWVILREAGPHDYYLNVSEYIVWRHQYERRCNHRGIMSLRKDPFETTSVCYCFNRDTISSFDCRMLIREDKQFFHAMRTSLLLSISWTVQLSITTFTRQMASGSSRFPQSKSSMRCASTRNLCLRQCLSSRSSLNYRRGTGVAQQLEG